MKTLTVQAEPTRRRTYYVRVTVSGAASDLPLSSDLAERVEARLASGPVEPWRIDRVEPWWPPLPSVGGYE